MTDYLRRVIVTAYELARRRNSIEISLQDAFIAILSEKKNIASRLLERMGVDIDNTIEELTRDYNPVPSPIIPTPSEELRRAISEAFLYSSDFGHVYVGTEHLLLALLDFNEEKFIQDLDSAGINEKNVRQLILTFGTYQPGIFSQGKEEEMQNENDKQSALNFFARDMNELAKANKFMEVWGRDDEVERVIHILSRKTKNNPILVGEAGVGKTAVIEGLVQRIVKGDVPKSFKNKTIIQLDLASIIAGSKIRGDVEERILNIVNEVSGDDSKILFIDEIHMIVGAGTAGQGSMDVANILKPHLTTGDLNVIGATTFDEYQKYFETDDALSRRFQQVKISEISQLDALKVLINLKPGFEKYHSVKIEDDAIEEAVNLSGRYITDRYFPDKVIDVIDEAAAGKKISKESYISEKDDIKEEIEELNRKKDEFLMKGEMNAAVRALKRERELQKTFTETQKKQKSISKRFKVGVEDVRRVISKWTKIPLDALSSKEIQTLKKLEPKVKEMVIGQDHGVEEVVSALKRSKVGINDAKRPLGAFLFLGPTGVGKTELAKVLAQEIFGSEDSFIQVDMSEFMEQHSVAKLIGSPPGYIGYQEGGQLTEKVRRNPYSLILFDEIEKAHPELLNILLQVMEEGKLQDSKGRSVNFKNTIIILTSNIGASDIKNNSVLGFEMELDEKDEGSEMFEKEYEVMKEKLTEELKDTLAPEFINRLDSVVIFRSLNEKDIEKIVKIHVNNLVDRLSLKNIDLNVSKQVLNFITKESLDSEYGGRNVRRKVQELLENPIAEEIIEKRVNLDSKKKNQKKSKARAIMSSGDLKISISKK
jgi:ATP-dependent Clp protease ATP-binding subunit ClpC